jgi:hypothetical protein
MARKKLLTEGEVRQFMKLANLGPLSENYFTNNPLEEESEEESELHATEDELGAEDHLADEEGDELDALAMDGAGEGESEELLARVVQAVADELGVEVDVEGAGEEGGEEDLEVDAELEEPLPGGGELEMGAMEDEEVPGGMDMYEDKAYTAKKEKPGADKRKGADKRGAEGTKKKTSGKGRGEKKGDDAYVNEDKPYTSKREKPGADKRKGADKRGAEGTKLKQDEPGGRGHKKGDDAYVNETHQLNELGPEAVEVASQVAQMMGDPGALAAAVAASPVVGALLDKLSNAMADSKVQAAVSASGAGEEEELSMDVAAINEDDIVAEVSRRVAARLQADKKREEVASQLAERIFDRLTSK